MNLTSALEVLRGAGRKELESHSAQTILRMQTLVLPKNSHHAQKLKKVKIQLEPTVKKCPSVISQFG